MAARHHPTSARGAGVRYASVAATRSALEKRTGLLSREEAGWFIVADKATSTFWSFSGSDEPAYPAVVKRTIIDDHGKISVTMSTLCEAPKPACNGLIAQFNKLNQRMRTDLQQQHDKQLPPAVPAAT